MKILIDNGHGRETPGKRSPDGRLREYAYNRLIAGRIVQRLQALDLDAQLLVPEQEDIPLPERCRRVNELCRRLGKDNVILISIHVNAAGHGDRWMDATGWCAFTTRGDTRADALATSLYCTKLRHTISRESISARTTRMEILTSNPTSTSSAIQPAPPCSQRTSSWTPCPTTASSLPKKANNRSLTSMWMPLTFIGR